MEVLKRALEAARRQGVGDDLPLGTTIELPSIPLSSPAVAVAVLADPETLPLVTADDLVPVEHIGRGGQATIDAVLQTSLEREVAVKRLLPQPQGEREAADSLMHEARLTGGLEHPNIIPVHLLARSADGTPLMVMKRVEGVNWHELVADPEHPGWEGRPTDLLVAHLEILVQVCRAMEYAHSREIVHLDIKPGNVMVGEYGEVYLMDWGLGGHLSSMPREDDGLIAGTPSYMAPEMVAGRSEVTLASDIYLLGATLHRVLTGRVRNHGIRLADRLQRALLSPPAEYGPQVPPELGVIANRACQRRPANRYRSVRAFREAVEEYVQHRGAMRIIRAAKEQLAELEMLSAAEPTDVWRPGARQERQVALAMAARFGFENALQDWPENSEVRAGLQRALELAIELELDRGLPQAAAALLADLPEPRPDLAARVEALHKDVRARGDATARLKKIEFDLDFAGAGTLRSIGFALNGVTWGGLALLWGAASKAGLLRNTPIESLLLAIAGTAAIGLSLHQVRALMLDNRIRRRFTTALVVYVAVFDLTRVIGVVLDLTLTDMIITDHCLLVLFVGLLAALIHRALFRAFVIAVAAMLATVVWPEYLYEIVALDLLGINFVFAWLTRPGSLKSSSNSGLKET